MSRCFEVETASLRANQGMGMDMAMGPAASSEDQSRTPAKKQTVSQQVPANALQIALMRQRLENTWEVIESLHEMHLVMTTKRN